ncbi:hypothetical protein MFIFM68171_11118 [Madurella fahalii]|uniref:Ricin B lectin domain-containing protein n=1 Tax=Madurella fahalii TaxID=1157608 RepID=A0ABQ0GT45_9PEZI
MHLCNFLAMAGCLAVSMLHNAAAQIGPPGWQYTGYYAIYNVATNTSLTLVNGNPNNGATIAGYPNNWVGNQDQLWYVITVEVPVPDTVLIINNGTFSAMAAMSSQAPVTGQTNLVLPDRRMLWARETTNTLGAYRFRNLQSPNQYLDMDHSNPAPGTLVLSWQRNNPDTPNQMWYMQLMAE